MTTRCRWALWSVAIGAMLVTACDSSRPTIGGDAGPDASKPRDLAPKAEKVTAGDRQVPTADQVTTADMDLKFPAVLEGVWLIGWSGGLNHFSWVRFAKLTSPSAKSEAWILDGKDIVGNSPLWNCSGKTTWWMGAAAMTAYLDFPSTSCDPKGSAMEGLVFSDFAAPKSGPAGAFLSATVKEQATLTPMMGFKFPTSWCDAGMTSCKSPF